MHFFPAFYNFKWLLRKSDLSLLFIVFSIIIYIIYVPYILSLLYICICYYYYYVYDHYYLYILSIIFYLIPWSKIEKSSIIKGVIHIYIRHNKVIFKILILNFSILFLGHPQLLNIHGFFTNWYVEDDPKIGSKYRIEVSREEFKNNFVVPSSY